MSIYNSESEESQYKKSGMTMKKSRLEKYLIYKGIRPALFARKLGISSSHITEIDQRKSNRTLYLAIKSNSEFSDCNVDWIDTGEGEMFSEALRQVAEGIVTEGGAVDMLPDPSRMTLEQKLNWAGLKTKDIRQIQEWAKLTEEEQDEELKRLCMQNIEKGRY